MTSNHHVRINGITYMPTVYSHMGPDYTLIRNTMEAKPGSETRNDGLKHFARLYRVDNRTAFLIVRSIYLRPRKYARIEAERLEARRIVNCRRFGCCNV